MKSKRSGTRLRKYMQQNNAESEVNSDSKQPKAQKLKNKGFARITKTEAPVKPPEPVKDASPEQTELLTQQFLQKAEAPKDKKAKDPHLRSTSMLYKMNLEDKIALEAVSMHLRMNYGVTIRHAIDQLMKDVPAETMELARLRATEAFESASANAALKRAQKAKK